MTDTDILVADLPGYGGLSKVARDIVALSAVATLGDLQDPKKTVTFTEVDAPPNRIQEVLIWMQKVLLHYELEQDRVEHQKKSRGFPADFIARERKPSPHYQYNEVPLLECPLCEGHSNLAVHSRQVKIAASEFTGYWVSYVRCNSCECLGPFSISKTAMGAEELAAKEWNFVPERPHMSDLLARMRASPMVLEKHLIPQDRWDACTLPIPRGAREVAAESEGEGVPTAIGWTEGTGYYVLATAGQGPMVLWMEADSDERPEVDPKAETSELPHVPERPDVYEGRHDEER